MGEVAEAAEDPDWTPCRCLPLRDHPDQQTQPPGEPWAHDSPGGCAFRRTPPSRLASTGRVQTHCPRPPINRLAAAVGRRPGAILRKAPAGPSVSRCRLVPRSTLDPSTVKREVEW